MQGTRRYRTTTTTENMHKMEKQQKNEKHTVDRDFSPDYFDKDLSPEHLEQLKKNYETKVVVTPEQATQIKRQTHNQADSDKWIVEGRSRTMASTVGGIVKMRNTYQKSEDLVHTKFREIRSNTL